MLSTRDDDISTSSTVKGQVWAESPDEETKQCLQSLRSKVQSMDLTPKELEWCDDACLLRYLRARNNHVRGYSRYSIFYIYYSRWTRLWS